MADAQTAGEAALPVPDTGTEVEQEIVAEYLAYDDGQDNGVDLGQWLTYRMTHALAGLPPIGGFAQISDFGAEYQSAFHLFGGLYVGILVSQEMEDEFSAGQPWSSTATDWLGGHCVPHLARDAARGVCITWGAFQPFTWDNWHVTRERGLRDLLGRDGQYPGGVFHGVNVAQLRADILALHGTTA